MPAEAPPPPLDGSFGGEWRPNGAVMIAFFLRARDFFERHHHHPPSPPPPPPHMIAFAVAPNVREVAASLLKVARNPSIDVDEFAERLGEELGWPTALVQRFRSELHALRAKADLLAAITPQEK